MCYQTELVDAMLLSLRFRILSTLHSRQRHFYTATTATAKQRLGRPPQTSARAGASSFIIILAHSFPEHFTAFAWLVDYHSPRFIIQIL